MGQGNSQVSKTPVEKVVLPSGEIACCALYLLGILQNCLKCFDLCHCVLKSNFSTNSTNADMIPCLESSQKAPIWPADGGKGLFPRHRNAVAVFFVVDIKTAFRIQLFILFTNQSFQHLLEFHA